MDGLPKVSLYRLKAHPGLAAKVAKELTEFPHTFAFNLRLKPECQPDRYFCSELIYCGFRSVLASQKTDEFANPYPVELWSKTDDPIAERFASKVVPLYWGPIPAPGDVELNPDYTAIAHWVRPNQIPRLRVQFVFTNVLFTLLDDNPELRRNFIESLAAISSKKRFFRRLLSWSNHGRELVKEFDETESKSQGEVPTSSILFYSYIQFLLLPEIENKCVAQSTKVPLSLKQLRDKITREVGSNLESFIRLSRLVSWVPL